MPHSNEINVALLAYEIFSKLNSREYLAINLLLFGASLQRCVVLRADAPAPQIQLFIRLGPTHFQL